MGRGVRRRRRKRGLVQYMSREQMACGPHYSYRIVYDLKPGDVFKFVHRHKAVDYDKAVRRYRLRNWSLDHQLDFAKGTIIVWTGKWWLTPLGAFTPLDRWWKTYVVHVEPISVEVPKMIKLRMWKDLTRNPTLQKEDLKKIAQKLGFVETIKGIFHF